VRLIAGDWSRTTPPVSTSISTSALQSANTCARRSSRAKGSCAGRSALASHTCRTSARIDGCLRRSSKVTASQRAGPWRSRGRRRHRWVERGSSPASDCLRASMNSADEGSSSNKSNGTPSTSARVKSCGSAENPYTAVTRRSAPISSARPSAAPITAWRRACCAARERARSRSAETSRSTSAATDTEPTRSSVASSASTSRRPSANGTCAMTCSAAPEAARCNRVQSRAQRRSTWRAAAKPRKAARCRPGNSPAQKRRCAAALATSTWPPALSQSAATGS